MDRKPVHLQLASKTFFELVFGQSADMIPDGLPQEVGGEAGRISLLARLNEICFTNGVDTLRQGKFVPSQRINAAANVMFGAAGGVVPVSFVDRPGNLRFWYEGVSASPASVNGRVAVVLLPSNFYVRCFVEPVRAMQDLVAVCSMVKDYLAGRMRPGRNVTLRVAAYLSEMFRALSEVNPGLVLDDNQAEIVRHFPFGFDSLPADLLYD